MPGKMARSDPQRRSDVWNAGSQPHLPFGLPASPEIATIQVSSGFIRGIPVNCCTHPRAVIARSNATKQSRVSSIKTGLLCCARNDENVYAASERRKPSHIAVAEPESSTRT